MAKKIKETAAGVQEENISGNVKNMEAGAQDKAPDVAVEDKSEDTGGPVLPVPEAGDPIGALSITELKAYLDSCVILIDFYYRQYEIGKDDESARLKNRYNVIYYRIKDEIEKRINGIWGE